MGIKRYALTVPVNFSIEISIEKVRFLGRFDQKEKEPENYIRANVLRALSFLCIISSTVSFSLVVSPSSFLTTVRGCFLGYLIATTTWSLSYINANLKNQGKPLWTPEDRASCFIHQNSLINSVDSIQTVIRLFSID